MKIITLLLLSILISTSLADEDIRSKVAETQKVQITTTEIDVGNHIFGHKYGTSENNFIAKEGKPDGYISLSNGKTVMIYGSDVAFVFRNKLLIGLRISSHIFDWELAKELKSKSRFDGINWRVKQGVFNNMSKKQLLKKHGNALRGQDYERFLQLDKDRLVIRFSSSQMNDGERTFSVCGIYLTRE